MLKLLLFYQNEHSVSKTVLACVSVVNIVGTPFLLNVRDYVAKIVKLVVAAPFSPLLFLINSARL